jgi:phage terminase large subunit
VAAAPASRTSWPARWSSIVCCIPAVLPHDGVNTNMVTGLRYADHLRDAEFKVEVIPNQGAGAAAMRIEAVRRIFPKVWFNEATTEAGRDALGFYHAKKDEGRDVDLGPEHDWSSHAADAFGLMARRLQGAEPIQSPARVAAARDCVTRVRPRVVIVPGIS